MQSNGKNESWSDIEVNLDNLINDLATGKYAYAPSSSLPFPRSPKQWDDEQSVEESSDSEDNLQPTSSLTDRRRSGREEHAALLADKIGRMCEGIENRCATMSLIERSAESTSIKEVMKVVTSLRGVEQGTKLWLFATRLFLNQGKREMFCTMEDPNLKLEWLKFESSVDNTSIKEVMKVVSLLPGAEQGTKLWFHATRLFLNQEKREMFCTMEDPDLKLEWLQFEMVEK